MSRFVTISITLFLAFLQAHGAVVQAQAPIPHDVVRMVRETPVVSPVMISPDGSKVAYMLRTRSVVNKTASGELLVQELNGIGAVNGLPISVAKAVIPSDDTRVVAISFQWCPDSNCLVFRTSPQAWVSITPEAARSGDYLRYDFRTGQTSALASVPINDIEAAASGRARITSVPAFYKMSPSGRYLLFTQRVAPGVGIDKDVATVVTPEMLRRGAYTNGAIMSLATRSKNGLFVFDTGTGNIRQLTPNNTAVDAFVWSPNGEKIAFTGYAGDLTDAAICGERAETTNGLFVVDYPSGAIQKIIDRGSRNPLWSPDGKHIAFSNNDDLAVVSADGGRVRILTGEETTAPTALFWSSDSRTLYFTGPYRMGSPIRTVDIANGRASIPSPNEFADYGFSMSRDGLRMAFVRSSSLVGPEVLVKNIAGGTVHQITKLAGPDLSSVIHKEKVNWKSHDGKTIVEGLLYSPAARSRTDGPPISVKPLPLITFIQGGPSMVRDLSGSTYLPLYFSLVSRGYAIFVPNTRQRPGYGKSFDSNGDVIGPALLPYADLMSGVDMLVKRGIADADRLGIAGHSFGGYVTAYAITQTNQFRAAINYEGAFTIMATQAMAKVFDSDGCERGRLWGFRNPFDPKERDKLIAQSPAFNVHKVKTPTMLIYGTDMGSLGNQEGRMLDSGLRLYKIPSEFIVYSGGHYATRVSQEDDILMRISAWFDYWLRDMPYSDKERQKEYDAWKAKHSATPKYTARAAKTKGHRVN